MAPRSAREQVAQFMARYDPAVAAVARAVLRRLRARLPGAVEIVYDNYNALVIGFGPTDRTSEAILSIALYPRWVSLFFLRGAVLPDPERVLKGSGSRVRHVVLDDAKVLDRPAIRVLIGHALANSPKPLDAGRVHRMVVKSVSAKQRPRRPRDVKSARASSGELGAARRRKSP